MAFFFRWPVGKGVILVALCLVSLLLFAVWPEQAEDLHQSSLGSVVENCSISTVSRGEFIACFKARVSFPEPPDTLMHQLAEYYQASHQLPTQAGQYGCHDVAHAIGQLEYSRAGSIYQGLESCSSICAYGCYHGLVEQAVADTGQVSFAQAQPCDQLDDRAQKPCFHGAGHGFLAVSGSLGEALGYCQQFQESEFGFENCAYGVFMEAFTPSDVAHQPQAFPENIQVFCAAFPPNQQKICLHLLGALTYLKTGDITAAVNVCQQYSDRAREVCLAGLGQELFVAVSSVQALREQTQRIAPKSDQFLLISGLAEAAVWVDPSARKGHTLCQELTDPALAEWCQNQIQYFQARFSNT